MDGGLYINRKKEIIRKINSMSGSRSSYDIFCDWVKLMAIAIQNQSCLMHDQIWRKRESEYIKTINSYGEKGIEFAKMFEMLAETMETGLADTLGEIYMESGFGNKNTGQFFTPFHVSETCAKLSLMGEGGSRVINMNEPSCGGGGMIIAAAKVLKERGINYQKIMRVVAQDLDWKAVHMCYVQLSLLGIDAVVVQGNTLAEANYRLRPRECVFRTPRNVGILRLR